MMERTGGTSQGTVSARPQTGMALSVVLPAYNEAANLHATVESALEVLRGLGGRFEVIIVDDGSRDGTGALADALARATPEVRTVHHPHNRGYGAAIRSGFTAAAVPWLFFTDADGQFDLRELPALLPHAARADIVAGYRLRRHDPWFRRLYALVFGRLLVRAVLGVRDLNCAFKLIRRDLVAGPPPQVRRRPHQRRAARQGAARRRTRHRGGRAPLPAPGGNADGRQPARDYARVPGTPCAARGDPGAARQAGPLSGALSPLERSVSASV